MVVSNSKWSCEEVAILRKHGLSKTDRGLQELLPKRTRGAISKKRCSLGIIKLDRTMLYKCAYCEKAFRARVTWKRFCSWACYVKSLRRKSLCKASMPVRLEERDHWLQVLPSESRKARAKKAGGSFTIKEFTAKCEKYNWQCAYCGCELDRQTATADHVTPLSRGGSSNISNIVPACLHCNLTKNTKTGKEFEGMA